MEELENIIKDYLNEINGKTSMLQLKQTFGLNLDQLVDLLDFIQKNDNEAYIECTSNLGGKIIDYRVNPNSWKEYFYLQNKIYTLESNGDCGLLDGIHFIHVERIPDNCQSGLELAYSRLL